jgi:ABC-type transport system involved in multi-copper enzyme maturation permease subunit
MNPMWMKQIAAVLRLEIRKSFFAKRGLWIYLLAAIPLFIWGGHALDQKMDRQRMRSQMSEGATSEKMLSIKRGMTKEEVKAILPQPRNVSSHTRRNGTEMLYWTFSDGNMSIHVSMKDGVVERVNTQRSQCDLAEDTVIFAGIFQFFYMRLAIFFGCMFVFMNLFRGEMLDRSLHYYFLAPIRRDILVIGKYLAGLVATVLIFGISTAMQWTVFLMHLDSQSATEYLQQNNGVAHLLAYLGVTTLACLGYGSVFLAAGILIRNPLVTAAVVLLWESINGILPAALRKISVIYYLKSLCPVEIPMQQGVPPPLAMLALNVDGATPIVAIIGLLALSVVVIYIATQRIKRMEINYGSD